MAVVLASFLGNPRLQQPDCAVRENQDRNILEGMNLPVNRGHCREERDEQRKNQMVDKPDSTAQKLQSDDSKLSFDICLDFSILDGG